MALARAASAYKAFVKANAIAPKFIPHARTWLNQGRHEDWMNADAPASAPDGGPSPEHPLFPLFAEVGAARWASYFAPLVIERDGDACRLTAMTKFALDRLRRGWGQEIETVLGSVAWDYRRSDHG